MLFRESKLDEDFNQILGIETHQIMGETIDFYPIREITNLFKNGRDFFGTTSTTVDLLYLLLQRAVEVRFPKISFQVEKQTSSVESRNNMPHIKFEYIESDDERDLRAAINPSFPINSIVVFIKSYNIWYSLIAQQKMDYIDNQIYCHYPDKIFIDRFGITKSEHDYKIDIRQIFKSIHDFCTIPTSMEIEFHLLESKLHQTINDMTQIYGPKFKAKPTPNSRELLLEHLRLKYQELKNHYPLEILSKELDQSMDQKYHYINQKLKKIISDQMDFSNI